MSNRTFNSPRELVNQLIDILPALAKEWNEGEVFSANRECTYHVVFLSFGPKSLRLLDAATTKQIKEFCVLINYAVEKGGELENAVSTCFLEHASQIGVRKMLKPYLSAKAKGELR